MGQSCLVTYWFATVADGDIATGFGNIEAIMTTYPPRIEDVQELREKIRLDLNLSVVTIVGWQPLTASDADVDNTKH